MAGQNADRVGRTACLPITRRNPPSLGIISPKTQAMPQGCPREEVTVAYLWSSRVDGSRLDRNMRHSNRSYHY